ncbi:nuclear transport factor 2 family protein [Nocardioides sp. W7]|uniref:nuclear transport factor 2 family protein n=1 Tax=Nocardioides sp. W7 TaxID=2931390 RepID=UPI001FD5656D|nr:nuclear transport factor 2 family protein [Nocardioides sp. W7]
MAASNERIREVVEQYVALVASGTSAQIVDLYAEGATVEDPVGTDVLTTREQIAAFYATLDGLEQETRLVELRIAGGEAVFHFEITTKVGDARYVLAPFDAMTFDDDGLITSMRAFWSDTDMVVS